jgi:transcriptional regulator with XRE-family HTH domain
MSASRGTGFPPAAIRNGADLRAWRKVVGVTQEALAAATAVSQSWISLLENDPSVQPSDEWIARLRAITTMPVRWGSASCEAAPDSREAAPALLSPFAAGILSGAALGFAMGVAMGVTL